MGQKIYVVQPLNALFMERFCDLQQLAYGVRGSSYFDVTNKSCFLSFVRLLLIMSFQLLMKSMCTAH